VDWHSVDPGALFSTMRDQASPADAERMVWAFEQVLAAARIDPGLLDHVAAAVLCGLAYRDRTTPRDVAERLFRRSIGNDRWNAEYANLIDA
jgi:hypothetical protein